MRIVAYLATVALLASCHIVKPLPPPIEVHAWVADRRDLQVVRRIIALPVAGDEASVDFLDALGETFRAELAATRRFEVLSIGRDTTEEKALWKSERRGRLSVDALVDIGRRYQADGVCMLRVTSVRPWMPPMLGLRLQLVSVHSGDAVWVVDETFDSADENIQLDLKVYARDSLAPDPSLHETDMLQLSPRRFARYCSHRIVESLRKADA
ncbi:MAG: hypothetical protein KDC95_00675 [Planctomycetes bacterium]|nr:hypothetical protein [Planctomycetota bacterium]